MVKRKYLVWGWLIGCWAWATSSSINTRTRKVWDIDYRQLPPPAPHPPQLTTSVYQPAPPAPNAPAPVHQTVLSAPLSSFSNIPTSPPFLHSSIVSSATTTISSASNTSTTTSLSIPATTIITITALPPLDPTSIPTVVVHPKKPLHPESSFKLIYLVPVFVVLGLLWGSLVAWFVYGCATRKPKLRNEDRLIGGPRYVPPAAAAGGGSSSRDDDLEEGGDRALLHPPEDDGMYEATFSWPDLSEKAVRNYTGGVYKEPAEDDPFLLVRVRSPLASTPTLAPPRPPPPRNPNPKPPSVRAKSTRSTLTSHSDDAAYLYDTDEEYKKEPRDLPWESLRHKSIRRGILEKVAEEEDRINGLRPVSGASFRSTGVRRGGGYRGGQATERRASRHGRSDSDVLVGDIHQLLEERQTSSSSSSSSSKRSTQAPSLSSSRPVSSYENSTHMTHSVDTCRTHSTPDTTTDWKPGAGFRIVAEPPISREPTPMPVEDPPPPLTSPHSGWRSGGGGSGGDRYTHLPQRHADRNSQSPSPFKTPIKNHPLPTPSPHAHMLPRSPPQINSPLLHSALCFVTTPPPEARRRPAGTSARPAVAAVGSPLPMSPPLYDAKQCGRMLRGMGSPSSPVLSNPGLSMSSGNRIVRSPRHGPRRGDWVTADGSPSPRPPSAAAKRQHYRSVGYLNDGDGGMSGRRAAAGAHGTPNASANGP